MLSVKELLIQKTMPTWNDISLKLYKDFTVQYLLNRCFEYHLVNGTVICVQFKEWAMKHLWAIIHRCKWCGTFNSNRVAADDNPMKLMSIAMRPISQPPFPIERLEEMTRMMGGDGALS